MDKRVNEMWEKMTEYGIATDDEIGLVCGICGVSEHTLNRIIYVRCGMDYENFINELKEEEE